MFVESFKCMTTEVLMQRELFGEKIAQRSKSEFFSATDIVRAGNKFRRKNGLVDFNLAQFLNGKQFKEFLDSLEAKYEQKCVIKGGKGAGSTTWVHPLVFIDIALAISPSLKIEVYEWLYDHLLRYRNDSGDSYKEMSTALYGLATNKTAFGKYIQDVAMKIQKAIGVSDWQNATEDQLKQRDKIHSSIRLLCNVLKDPDQAVRIGISENLTLKIV
jgi:hypothetical protein